MAKLGISLFGQFQVLMNGVPVTQFESVKVRALLAFLATEYTRPHTRESLATLLWPDWPQQSAMSNLRYALADLRKNIGNRDAQPPFLLITRDSLLLNHEADVQVDVTEFQEAIGDQRSMVNFTDGISDPQSTINNLKSAISFYRGPFLEGFSLPDSAPFEEWLLAKREYFSQKMLKALSQLAYWSLEQGEYEQAEGYARQQIELEPWREQAYQQLMRALSLKGERVQALTQFESLRKALQRELKVEPSEETVELYQQIRDGMLGPHKEAVTTIEAPLLLPVERLHHNLPPELTSFIGHQAEITHLTDLITSDEHRLVTLTGSGGTGKTRLALRVARALLNEFEDGVWLVDLAPLVDPKLVTLTTAQALGLHEVPGLPIRNVLTGYLKNKRLLLILDNCEHLLAECSSLADALLIACPRLHLLATSREILGVPGETPFRVPPLTTPDPKHVPAMEQLPQFDAVRLFVERAGRAAPEFTLDESNAVSVASICQRLDGIPLAIELAAARVRVMPAPQIAARLDNIFRLLTGGSRNVQPRQQTLKATMDWSYALLSLVEKLTLQRLSTFAGSCTLEAAESVLPGEEIETPEVLDLLTSLMDKSLILTVATSGGSIRYRMLETVRQYAHDHLLESGGGEAARDRHLAYYLQLSEQADACLRGKDQLAWLERLEEELDNLRLALDWSLVGHLEEGLRLASGLMWFWHIHTHHNEAVQRLGDLLAAEAGNRGSQPLAVGVQSVSYLLAWIRVVHAVVFLDNFHPPSFTLEQKMAMISSSIALCRELGQAASRELAWGLIVIGVYTPQDSEQSILYLQESLAISRRELYPYYEAHCFYFLSDFSFMKGDIQQAIQYKEQGLAFFRKIGDVDGIASCLVDLAKVVFYQGDQARARALVEEGLAYYKKAGNLQASNGFCALLLRIMPDPDTIQRAEEALAFCRETQDIVQGNILLTLSEVLWSQGDFPRAEGYGQDVIAYVQEVGGERFRTSMMACLWLGRLALTQNNLLKAGQYFKTAVLCMRKRASSFAGLQVFVYILDALAVWSAAGGNMERAARALGALEELYQRFVPDMLPRMCSEHDAALATVRQTLGEQAFDQAWNEGKALTLEQALEAVRQAEGWEEED